MDARVFKGAFALGTATQTAATVITALIPPYQNRKTRVTDLVYRCGSTVNILSLMRPLGATTVTTAVAEAGTAMTVTANPGVTGNTAATNDWVVVELADGRYHLSLVTVSSLTFTLSTAVPADTGGIAANAKLWWYGLPGDTGHLQITPAASTTNRYSDGSAGIFTTGLPANLFDTNIYANRSGLGDPVVLHSPNATAQCWIEKVSGYYAAY